ncbi:sperm receptor for egg jelly-like [Dendronephthya gigantea]|uniref:sperm receptor for egg jelly-like n=1 Tax=Dendronephthya gigantea TaxID=151771 RepID=UPI00106DAD79|nr:sperm receptor for egg jelly-like [Dendronephthya gigantea]
MDATFMIEGKTYIITLVASKVDPVFGLRRSATEIYLQVALGLPPSLQMKCLKNCQEKVNPDERVTAKAFCTTNCYGQLAFKWRLYWFDRVDMTEPFDLSELNEVPLETLSNMVTNPVDELELAFKSNTLKPERKYILQLKATRPNKVFGELRYTMLMNNAPKEGECDIQPKTGVAMTTMFNLTCMNWTDPDPPINYEFSYKLKDVKTVFFSATLRTSQILVARENLPIGDPNRNNEIDIYVNIKDRFEGETELHFIVKVDPPGGELGLSSMDSMLSGDSLSKMIADGDPQKALAMAGVFASVLNHINGNDSTSGNLTAEEQERKNNESQQVDEFKQAIMKSLFDVKVENMDTLLQISGITQALTDNAEKLSPTSQEYGLMLSNASVTSLTKLSKGESSFKNVDSAVTNLANTIGQLVVAATKPRDDQNGTINNEEIIRAQKSISMISDLHDAKLRYLVTNEGPSTSSTKHMTLQSEKVSIRNMGKNGNSASNCSFKTPSPEVFGFGDIVKDINATISQLDSVTIKVYEIHSKND